jgi:UTP-glucose-1-phosphate uridylyltransferase
MAAGIGSRYGGLKQVDPVGPSGEIIIDYSIFDAIKAGFSRIVFVIRKKIEGPFREKIGDSVEQKAEVTYVFQETDNIPEGFNVPAGREKPWGTGHAVLCAKGVVDAPSAVINADDFYGADSFKILYNFLKNSEDHNGMYNFCMVGYILENTLTEHGHVARGICSVDNNGYLSEVVERIKIQKFQDGPKYTEDDKNWVLIPQSSIVSMNMWGFTLGYYAELEKRFGKFLEENSKNLKAEYYIPTIVNELIQEKKATVKVLTTNEKWFGVTYQEDRPVIKDAVMELIKKGVYPERLWD